jgi:hypothetical protein
VKENPQSGALKVNIKIIQHKDQVASQFSTASEPLSEQLNKWQEALGKIDTKKSLKAH